MKPTDEQKQWLQDYLSGVLTYRETYIEVYDHVLSALENQPERHFFETTVNEIIVADFGDNNGLMKLEEECKNSVDNEVRMRYRYYFMRWLRFPNLLFTLFAFAAIYFATWYFKTTAAVSTFGLMFIVPICLLAIRGFKTGYVFGNIKTAMRDKIFSRIAYRLIWSLYVVIGITNILSYYISPGNKSLSVLNLTIILMLLIIHATIFFKLYKDEFKMNITR